MPEPIHPFPAGIPVYGSHAQMPRPGLYLGLFHGRATAAEIVDGDWGSQGPVIGPLAFAHTTYRDNKLCLRFIDQAAAGPYLDLFLGNHRLRDLLDATTLEAASHDAYVADLFLCHGTFYGDWTLFRHVPQHRTNPPKPIGVDELLSCNLLGRLRCIDSAIKEDAKGCALRELKDLIENFVRPMQSDHNP